MKIIIISAVAKNGVIGKANGEPILDEENDNLKKLMSNNMYAVPNSDMLHNFKFINITNLKELIYATYQ